MLCNHLRSPIVFSTTFAEKNINFKETDETNVEYNLVFIIFFWVKFFIIEFKWTEPSERYFSVSPHFLRWCRDDLNDRDVDIFDSHF